MLPTQFNMENPMDKIKEITISLKKWHALLILSALAVMLSYLLAVTSPGSHNTVGLFHMMGMMTSGIAGTVLFIAAIVRMLEDWDD